MVNDLSQKELQEMQDISDLRDFDPGSMQDGDWDRYNDLRDKRFEGE